MKLGQYHILYIEDHEDTRDFVTLVLEGNNYKVTTSTTIAEALRLAEKTLFDLYLLDSWLPDGSGLDLCKKLRDLDGTTPILFYSAAAYEADKENALNCGAQGYLIKPSHNAELCDTISLLIAHSANGNSSSSVARA